MRTVDDLVAALDTNTKTAEAQARAAEAQTLVIKELVQQAQRSNAEIQMANSTQQQMAATVHRMGVNVEKVMEEVRRNGQHTFKIAEELAASLPEIFTRISALESQNKKALDETKKAAEAAKAAAGGELTTTDKLLAHSQKTTETMAETMADVVNTLMEHTGQNKLPTREELAAAEKTLAEKESKQLIPNALREGGKIPPITLISFGIALFLAFAGLGVGIAALQWYRQHMAALMPANQPPSASAPASHK